MIILMGSVEIAELSRDQQRLTEGTKGLIPRLPALITLLHCRRGEIPEKLPGLLQFQGGRLATVGQVEGQFEALPGLVGLLDQTLDESLDEVLDLWTT